MIESRKHSGEVSAAESDELEQLVFDLVRERLLRKIGSKGMWTIAFRRADDTDAMFSETVAESVARDIAAQIAVPQPVSLAAAQAPSAEPSIEESFGEIIGWDARPEQELESVSDDTASEHATVELEATVELDETMAFDENIALDDTVTAEVAAYVELDDDLERYKPRLVA